MDFFDQKVVLILSPQPWNYLFISKHHYARELAKGNYVYYVGPPEHGEHFSYSCSDEENNKRLKIVSYTILCPNWLRFRFPSLYKKIVRYYLIKFLVKLCDQADVCIDFGCYQQFDSMDFIRARFKIFFPVDDDIILGNNLDRGANLILTVSQNVQRKYTDGRCFLIGHGLAEEFSTHALNRTQQWIKGDKIRVGCSGNLFIRYLDIATLQDLILRNPKVEFHFFGSLNANRSNEQECKWLQFLKSTANVRLHGMLSAASLAKAYDEMDILLLCYRPDYINYHGDNSHKVLEYLSSGKTIVSSYLSMYKDSKLIEMAPKDRNDFIIIIFQKVVTLLSEYNSYANSQFRTQYALDNTYQKNLSKIVTLIEKQII